MRFFAKAQTKQKKKKKKKPPRPTQKELMKGSGSWDGGRLGGIKGEITEWPRTGYAEIWKSIRNARRRAAGTTPGYGATGAGSAGVTSAMFNVGALGRGVTGQSMTRPVVGAEQSISSNWTTGGGAYTNARSPIATQGIGYSSYLSNKKRVRKSSRSRSKRRRKRSRSRSKRRRKRSRSKRRRKRSRSRSKRRRR